MKKFELMNEIGLTPAAITESIHRLMIRVYYEDTDAGGIVYYANYLKFAERARTEMLREIGYEHKDNEKNYEINFVVRTCSIEFYKPGFLDDLLEVQTRILMVRGASIRMRQIIKKKSQELALIEIKLACVSFNGNATRIPMVLRNRMSGLIFLKGDG